MSAKTGIELIDRTWGRGTWGGAQPVGGGL